MFINHYEDTWRGIKKRKQYQLHLNDETKTVGIQLVLRLRKVGYFLNHRYLEFRCCVSVRVLKNSPSLIVIDYHWLILMISWCKCLWPVSQPFIFFSSIYDIIVPEWRIAAAEKTVMAFHDIHEGLKCVTNLTNWWVPVREFPMQISSRNL